MAIGSIEAELQKATGVKAVGGARQKYLSKLVNAADKLDDAGWKKLSKEAQKWCNLALKADNADAEIKDFEGDDEPEERTSRRRSDDDDDEKDTRGKGRGKDDEPEEEERSSRGRRTKDEEEKGDKDEPRGRSRGRDKDDEPEEKEERSSRGRRSEEEEEGTRGGKGAKGGKDKDEPRGKGRGKAEESDKGSKAKGGKGKDKDEELPRPRGREVDGKIVGIKVNIKRCVINNPDMSVDEICKELSKGKSQMSRVTVSGIRAEFRHSLKVLQQEGCLKGIKI